jgi:hypothetical protein
VRHPPEAEGGQPNYWCGLRPATPTNIPFIGHTGVGRLWVNAGHGTLGWTHGAGSGKALAALISGERPAMDFGFLGQGRDPVASAPAPGRGLIGLTRLGLGSLPLRQRHRRRSGGERPSDIGFRCAPRSVRATHLPRRRRYHRRMRNTIFF